MLKKMNSMKYFSFEEFDSPDKPGSGSLMDDNILMMLDDVREKFGKPIRINSGYRTIEHNAKVGGVSTSSHTKGLAADISCKNSEDRYKLVALLLETGFNRIGIASTFIHIDIDPDKSPSVIWTY
jgi:uncharacterized protein YcbK (DUF882 family)